MGDTPAAASGSPTGTAIPVLWTSPLAEERQSPGEYGKRLVHALLGQPSLAVQKP